MLNMRESWTDERMEEILIFLSLTSTTVSICASMAALILTRT